MFEIGFQEILLIFVIALVVLGPERLPKLVAQVGRWAGKAKSMARQFREQLESEINLDELNKASKSAPAKPWTETPAADAPVPDPSSPVAPMEADSPAWPAADDPAPAPPVADTPYVAPDDDFAHHSTQDYPYTPPSTADSAADVPPTADPERSTADMPVVSTHERL